MTCGTPARAFSSPNAEKPTATSPNTNSPIRILRISSSPLGHRRSDQDRGPREARDDDQVHSRTGGDREVRARPGPARVHPPDRGLGHWVPETNLDDLRLGELRRDLAREVVDARVREADP